jgi:hypothetical protein
MFRSSVIPIIHFCLFIYSLPPMLGTPFQRIKSAEAVVWLKCSTHCHIREMELLEIRRILLSEHIYRPTNLAASEFASSRSVN